MIFSEESSFSLFPTTGPVYVCRKLKEAVHPDGDSVMIWGVISLKSAGPMISLYRRINTRDYLKVLSDQIYPIAQALFPEGNTIFKDDNAPIHTARIVKE